VRITSTFTPSDAVKRNLLPFMHLLPPNRGYEQGLNKDYPSALILEKSLCDWMILIVCAFFLRPVETGSPPAQRSPQSFDDLPQKIVLAKRTWSESRRKDPLIVNASS